MTSIQILSANLAALCLLLLVYRCVGWSKVHDCYSIWLTRKYWTNYNTVEFLSWTAKATIIVPGLIFGVSIWQLYFLTLATSLSLIWASNKKLLPTLVGFNTIWAWISCMVLARHLL